MCIEKFYVTTYQNCEDIFNKLLFVDNMWVEYLTSTVFAVYCSPCCVDYIRSNYNAYVKCINKFIDVDLLWVNYINIWGSSRDAIYMIYPIAYNTLVSHYLRTNNYGHLEYLSGEYSLLVIYYCSNEDCVNMAMIKNIMDCHITEIVLHIEQTISDLEVFLTRQWVRSYKDIFDILVSSYLFKRVGLSLARLFREVFIGVARKLVTVDLYDIECGLYRLALSNKLGINITSSSDVACVRPVLKAIMRFLSDSNSVFTVLKILRRKFLMPDNERCSAPLNFVIDAMMLKLNKYLYLGKCQNYSILHVGDLSGLALLNCLVQLRKRKFEVFYKCYCRMCKLLLSKRVMEAIAGRCHIRHSLAQIMCSCCANQVTFNNLFMFMYCVDQLLLESVVSELSTDSIQLIQLFVRTLGCWPRSFLFTL